jgi:hypothetical protein
MAIYFCALKADGLTRTRPRQRREAFCALVLAVVVLMVAACTTPRVGDDNLRGNPVPPAGSTPFLPFDMPIGPSDRKVFAHYVPWIPISVDNLPAEKDYYTTQLMNPDGENGIHRAYGGLFRDRPAPRPPVKSPNFKDVDVATDISQAKSVSVDGFAVDVLSPATQDADINRVLTAADAAGDFNIQITADMTGRLAAATPAEFASQIAPYLKAASIQRLTDGRVVLGAFFAERQPVAWWSDVLNEFRTGHGLDVAFVPTFLDADAYIDAFAPISYGLSNWGFRNPSLVDPPNTQVGMPTDLVRRAHHLGKIWMQPVAFQDNRPQAGTYEESLNGVTNRNAWLIATKEGAEWANLITWNDYAETTAIAPSSKHGWRILDMDAYRIAIYKYGAAPPVVREALFVSHRTQPFAAMPTTPEGRRATVSRWSHSPPRAPWSSAPSETRDRNARFRPVSACARSRCHPASSPSACTVTAPRKSPSPRPSR